MAKLSEPVKVFIVQHLACFDSPQRVADAVKEEYGITIDRRQVEEYDPEKRCRTRKWRELHAATREAFKKDVSRIAIAQKSFRMRELDRLYHRTATGTRPNTPLAKEILVEAEKFMGEAYTNRRVLVPGDPLNELAKLLGYTPEQLSTMLAFDDSAGAPA